jgi:hypothetical protein
MFSVMIRNHISRNRLITEKLRIESPLVYEHIIKVYNVQPGDMIEFFSGPPKEYPVLGYVGKSSMRLEASNIQVPGQPAGAQQAIYNETDFMMLPDNLGYIRLVLMMDLAISHYETPINLKTFEYPENAIMVEDPSTAKKLKSEERSPKNIKSEKKENSDESNTIKDPE